MSFPTLHQQLLEMESADANLMSWARKVGCDRHGGGFWTLVANLLRRVDLQVVTFAEGIVREETCALCHMVILIYVYSKSVRQK